ncbi:MAG TPA: GTP cyclohydrolase I FolE [Candidatus Micrarchaeia archaeon]|nr:GTP cyclohydrolase I FolE [Candidatus Micrarchaeia archaeon]
MASRTLGPRAEAAVRTLLELIGEDPERAGLRDTPRRVAESLAFLTSGSRADASGLLAGAAVADGYDEMVVVRDIALHSLCEHHLLPFHGVAHVAYLPAGRLVGLSKLARVVEVFARRLQVQERLTTEIALTIQGQLRPHGVAVVVEATHLCMSMRGVEKPHSLTVTSCMLGTFRRDPRTRAELLQLLRGPR